MPKHLEKVLLLLAIALIGTFTSSTVTSAPVTEKTEKIATSAISSTEWYKLTRVVDGDTIEIALDGKKTKVRLIGLDTPEVVDPRKPVQCFGKEASAELKKILGPGYVRLESDPSQDARDTFGRLLAYVYAPLDSNASGLLVNKYMIAEGYGHEYTYETPYKYQEDFRAAERSAREQQKGLWSPVMCGGDTK